MIRKACDRCEKTMEFDDRLAGQRVECPYCGDVNVLPAGNSGSVSGGAGSGRSATRDAASAKGLPPDHGPEQDVMKVRPSMWRSHPFLTLLTLGIGTFLLSMTHWGDSLRITNKRTILRRGLLSKSTTEVVHNDIRNIQIHQSFLNRVFGVGRLGISSAGQEGIEIVMDACPRPDRIKEVIDIYREM